MGLIQIHRNQSGFTLLEVLISMTLMMIVMTGVIEMVGLSNRSSQSATYTQVAEQEVRRVQMLLGNPDVCGSDPGTTASPKPTGVFYGLDVSGVSTSGATGSIDLNSPLSYNGQTVIDPHKILAPGLSLTSMKLEDFTTIDPTGHIFMPKLWMNFSKTDAQGNAMVGGSEVKRFVQVLLATDSSFKVTGCNSVTPVPTSQDFCTSMPGGVWDSTLKKCNLTLFPQLTVSDAINDITNGNTPSHGIYSKGGVKSSSINATQKFTVGADGLGMFNPDQGGALELGPTTAAGYSSMPTAAPYIDFHYGGNPSTSDYNVRMMNDGDRTLSIYSPNGAIVRIQDADGTMKDLRKYVCDSIGGTYHPVTTKCTPPAPPTPTTSNPLPSDHCYVHVAGRNEGSIAAPGFYIKGHVKYWDGDWDNVLPIYCWSGAAASGNAQIDNLPNVNALMAQCPWGGMTRIRCTQMQWQNSDTQVDTGKPAFYPYLPQ